MTDIDLDAIEARANSVGYFGLARAQEDFVHLVDEVRRLRAQVRDLTDSRQEARNEVRHYAAERDDARAAIARVRALHVEGETYYSTGLAACEGCYDTWPCDTIRALDGDA